ncbi:crustacean cardioactive peptide [Oratosquilla oratoria]|uniref:crustacean cardioactive peptide n=1 Tax=Oratosquilla oratoria TaxID=337810 RepID=UPI003F75DCA4
MQHLDVRKALVGCLVAAVVFVVIAVVPCNSSPVAARGDGTLEGKAKRPFCNAFTGCGRKRSVLSGQEALPARNDDDDDDNDAAEVPGPEDALSPPDAEALDDLASRILTEARLWEQLQTKMELIRVLASRLGNARGPRKKRNTTAKKQ